MSDFENLYKTRGNYKEKQSLRRAKILHDQRQKRENQFSFNRSIKSPPKHQWKKANRELDYSRNLMLSEWMMETPEDIEDFLLIPCPKGIRSTLSNEKTRNKNCRLYFKSGNENTSFKTNLPQNTILDCIFDKVSKTLFVLDVIKYDGRDFMNCDTAFRHFWIKNKFIEDEIAIIDENSDFKLHLLEAYDMSDSNLVHTCFQKHPIFDGGTELDGFLFYHKEADYTIGESPLVLWLFAFMIEEIFPMFRVHPIYHSQKPSDYTNYLDYIKLFNENYNKKKRRSRRKHDSSMEVQEEQTTYEEPFDEFDTQNEMQRMIELEQFGDFH